MQYQVTLHLDAFCQRRSTAYQSMTIQHIQDIVSKVTTLISLPKVSLEINRLIADDNASFAEITQLIELDPALSAALIRLSNSAALSPGQKIESVQRAISRLGLNQTTQLILAIESARSLEELPNELWPLEDFWHHSLSCAVIARLLCKRYNLGNPEAAFTAGLLHDIGQLILFSQLPDVARACLDNALESDCAANLFEAENQRLGFAHTDIGQELARQWALPDSLADCIAYHHHPQAYTGDSNLPAVVHLANSLAVLLELESRDMADAPTTDMPAVTGLGISIESALNVLDECDKEVRDLMRLFSPAEAA